MVLLLNKGMNLSSDCPEVVMLKWNINEAQNRAVGSSLTPSSVGSKLLKRIPNTRLCSTFSSATRTSPSIGICFQAPGDTCFHFDKTAKSSRSLVCPWISAQMLSFPHPSAGFGLPTIESQLAPSQWDPQLGMLGEMIPGILAYGAWAWPEQPQMAFSGKVAFKNIGLFVSVPACPCDSAECSSCLNSIVASVARRWSLPFVVSSVGHSLWPQPALLPPLILILILSS